MPLFLQINSRIPSFVMSLLTGVGFGGIPDRFGSFIDIHLRSYVFIDIHHSKVGVCGGIVPRDCVGQVGWGGYRHARKPVHNLKSNKCLCGWNVKPNLQALTIHIFRRSSASTKKEQSYGKQFSHITSISFS